MEFLCEDSENLLRGEGEDEEQVARILKHIPVLRLPISQLNSTLVYFLYCYYCSFIYMLDIMHTLYWIKKVIKVPQLLI